MYQLRFLPKKNYRQSPRSLGFTLPELLISIAIIGIILSVVVYSHQKFDSDLELTNVAYRVAVSIREAQVYGISVKEFNDNVTRRFDVPYGVNFYNTANPDSKKTYVFFGDSNPVLNNYPNIYDGSNVAGCIGGSTDECIERIVLGRGNIVSKFCVIQSDNNTYCFPDPNGTNPSIYSSVDSLNIVFKRPKPDAVITLAMAFGGMTNLPVYPPSNVTLINAFVCLQSPQGKLKKVFVSSAGQISVQDVPATGDPCVDANAGNASAN